VLAGGTVVVVLASTSTSTVVVVLVPVIQSRCPGTGTVVQWYYWTTGRPNQLVLTLGPLVPVVLASSTTITITGLIGLFKN
jgi:hypothetical protein